jgi:hypothetical protein
MFGFRRKKKNLKEKEEFNKKSKETIESIQKQIEDLKIEKGGKMVEEETEEDFEEEEEIEDEDEEVEKPKKVKPTNPKPKEKTLEDAPQEDVTLNQVLESFNQRLLAVEAKLFRIQSA